MSRIPEPQQTPRGPAYEGRLLDRPEDEVVDQGASFDIGTLITRRRVLSVVGAGVGAAALAACSSGGSSTTTATSSAAASSSTTSSSGLPAGEIPEETNGPYPADGTSDLNVLTESGIERSDITSSLDGGSTAEGVPLTFSYTLTDMANGNKPFSGAALYMWHCNAQGKYSMYSEGVEDETWLRGIQVADDNGTVTFKTIVPGCYAGRWTHLHFEVYPSLDSANDVDNAIATSQIAFAPEMLAEVYTSSTYDGSAKNLAGVGTQITDDHLFGDGDSTLQVPTITGNAGSGYVGTIAVGVDTTTTPQVSGGGGPGGQPPSGGPGGQPPN